MKLLKNNHIAVDLKTALSTNLEPITWKTVITSKFGNLVVLVLMLLGLWKILDFTNVFSTFNLVTINPLFWIALVMAILTGTIAFLGYKYDTHCISGAAFLFGGAAFIAATSVGLSTLLYPISPVFIVLVGVLAIPAVIWVAVKSADLDKGTYS